MEQVHTSVDDAKQMFEKMQYRKLIAWSTQTTTQAAEHAMHHNQKRATEIGPVLKEIPHPQWDSWGLND